MSSSKVLLERMIASANLMNSNVVEGDKFKYKMNEQLLNYVAEIATDMGLVVHIFWQRDGQICGVQCGKESKQAVIYECL